MKILFLKAFCLAGALLFSSQGFSRGWVALGKVTYVESDKDYVQIVVDGKDYFYYKDSPKYSPETRSIIYTAALTSLVSGKPVNILHDSKTVSNNGVWTIMELLAIKN